MIDHVGFGVSNLAAAKEFYAKALAPLGYSVLREYPVAVGLGKNHKPDVWLAPGGANNPPLHLAILAETREQVDAFYVAALAAGGRDNGAPGLRPKYHENYYGAFVLDLDGNNLEAVKHSPE